MKVAIGSLVTLSSSFDQWLEMEDKKPVRETKPVPEYGIIYKVKSFYPDGDENFVLLEGIDVDELGEPNGFAVEAFIELKFHSSLNATI
jgi:hypothetical protein